MTNFKTAKPLYDRKIAKDGIFVEITDGVNEFGSFRVGYYSPAFARIAASKAKLERLKNKLTKFKGLELAHEIKKLGITHFVESCLIDWKITDKDGKKIPYSEDAAIAFFLTYEEEDGDRFYTNDYAFTSLIATAEDAEQYQPADQVEAGDPVKN